MQGRRKESLVHTVGTLVTCILLCYTKICCLPAEPCETPSSGFEVRNIVALTVTVSIASFKMIGKLQSERLRESCAVGFS